MIVWRDLRADARAEALMLRRDIPHRWSMTISCPQCAGPVHRVTGSRDALVCSHTSVVVACEDGCGEWQVSVDMKSARINSNRRPTRA